jgi:hypothetical protein
MDFRKNSLFRRVVPHSELPPFGTTERASAIIMGKRPAEIVPLPLKK